MAGSFKTVMGFEVHFTVSGKESWKVDAGSFEFTIVGHVLLFLASIQQGFLHLVSNPFLPQVRI
jgi:hypothetical protein